MCVTVNLIRSQPVDGSDSLSLTLGKLRYIVDRTRWGALSAVAQTCVGGMKSPSKELVETCDRICAFLRETVDKPLRLGS